MGLVTSRLPWRQTQQENVDIWRLYQLVYYYKNCGGREIKLPHPPKKVPINAQKEVVKEEIISQIKSLSAGHTHSLTVCTESNQQIPGVKLYGHAFPGSIVCFFPGTVYLPSQIQLMPYYPRISHNNPHLMATTDGCVVDASKYQILSPELIKSPLAVGHLIQHPTSNILPNVMPYTLHVPNTLPQNTLEYIPNEYYNQGRLNVDTVLHTIVFIAMRHIKNEELFINYRLHPKSKYPKWYSPIDKVEDKRRWK